MDLRASLSELMGGGGGFELVTADGADRADTLGAQVSVVAKELASSAGKPLFLPLANRREDIIRLLGFLAAGAVPVVVPKSMPAGARQRLTAAYPLVAWDGEPGLSTPMSSSSTLSLIMPTSGSTGEPRLVVGTMDNLDHGLAAIEDAQGLGDIVCTGLMLPAHYSYGLVNQILWSVARGRRLVLLPSLATPGAALDQCRSTGVDMVCLVGQQIRALARLGFDRPEHALGDVRVVNFAGGPFPLDSLPSIRRLFPNARVLNNYGCTEAMPRISVREVRDGDDDIADVGHALSTLEVWSADADGVRIAAGETGALWCRGTSTAVGTLGADNQIVVFSSDGSFATGDQGQVAKSGHISVLGRSDQVVNVGGERLSLLHVEAIMRGLEGVHDAVARGVREQSGEQWILVCIASVDAVSKKDVRGHLVQHLPRAAWPRKLCRMVEFPLLPSGKADRRAILDRAEAGELEQVFAVKAAL